MLDAVYFPLFPTINGVPVATSTSIVVAYDQPGKLGFRRTGSPDTLYVDLGTLEYVIDEARRTQASWRSGK